MLIRTHLILYVADQDAATTFYAEVLDQDPTLHVPGMTEFRLSAGTVLGLMPEAGIVRLLGDAVSPLPRSARAELYLTVSDADAAHARALAAGATELSAMAPRSWGDVVAYSRDLDGHVLALARPS